MKLRNLLVAFGLSVLIVFGTPVLAKNFNKDRGSPYENTYRQLSLFGEVFERVRTDYVEDVDDKELVEAAINGMLVSLDPHSSYLNEEQFGNMQVQTRGEFGGLGIEVTMEDGFVKVVSPIEGTPADRAGLKPGDFVTHLDDEPVVGLTLNDAVDKMRGRPNTDIKLSISREGAEPFDVVIKRDIIKIISTRSKQFGDVGYIRINTFNEQTTSGLHKALKEMEKDSIKGYVLDLRNNPGGLLDEAISVADTFLDQGEIVSTRGRETDESTRFNATSGDMIHGKPVVVLINGGSASASEIVAGALQDHRRSILLGTKSFGKGSVQTIVPMPGHGAIRLTTARYYTPSGRSIQAKGIEPDIEVTEAKVEPVDSKPRTRESDLRGALDKVAKEIEEKDADKSKKPQSVVNMTEEEAYANDYQLSRALDLIRGLAWYKTTQNKPASQAKRKQLVAQP